MNMEMCMTLNDLVHVCHTAAYDIGWWFDQDGLDIRGNNYTFSNRLMLIVSELVEAMEADRKDLMDSHLPHRKGTEVELADAVIRIADLCGAYNLDLSGAIKEKMLYNKSRLDHKTENRKATGGKKY